MGLSTTHNCWQDSYSSFNEWRNVIAERAGYKLEENTYWYEGSLITLVEPRLNRQRLPKGAEYGEWIKTPSDPLVVLLAHSDCEGVIYPEQATPLANRLEQLIDRLPEQYIQESVGDFWFDLNPTKGIDYKGKTRQFIDGLRLAASRGEDVEFL